MKHLITLSVFLLTTQLCISQIWSTANLLNGISVKFPGPPTISDVGLSKKSYALLYDSCSFFVMVSNIAEDQMPTGDEETASVLDRVLGIKKATEENLLVSQNAFTIGDIKGREAATYTFEPKFGRKLKMYRKVFLYKNTLYQIGCAAANENDLSIQPVRDIFLNSISQQSKPLR